MSGVRQRAQCWHALALLIALAPRAAAAQDAVATEPRSAQSADDESSNRAISLHAGVGLGIGSVSFSRPTSEGEQVLDPTPFAAADLLVRLRAWPREAFALETLLAYHSSLGMRLQLAPLFALPQNVSARVEHAELSVAPVLRLTDGQPVLAIALPVGLGMQSLVSEQHQFGMPQYVVAGPQLRAELRAELGERVALRVGPQAQWLLIIASSLREQGACCQGVAIGAEGAIEARFAAHLTVALAYRQLSSFVSAPSTSFEHVERFLTARIAGGF